MTAPFQENPREIIPRWRDFQTTVQLGELNSPKTKSFQINNSEILADRVRDWTLTPNIWVAADLVSSAMVLNCPEPAVIAAKYLLEQNTELPNTIQRICEIILNASYKGNDIRSDERLEISQVINPGDRIRASRLSLNLEPRNAVQWMDIAWAYTVLGQEKKARNSIITALALAPENRFILRSAARFFVHIKEYTFAHNLLRKATVTRYDPWLIAAEVGLAELAEHSPRFAKQGLEFLQDANIFPNHLAELASALATFEIKHGKSSNAKKLFRQALISPTENALAQITWASNRHLDNFNFDPNDFKQTPLNFEAYAREFYYSADWQHSYQLCNKWLDDQPFASTPVFLGVQVANLMENFNAGSDIIKRGLAANPSEPMLWNNLAFTYASMNKVIEANNALAKIETRVVEFKLGRKEEAILWATRGLIQFREGKIEAGRNSYMRAIEELFALGNKRDSALASIYLAREEIVNNTEQAVKALIRAEESVTVLDRKRDLIIQLENVKIKLRL